MSSLDTVARLIRSHRFDYATEADLQHGLAVLFAQQHLTAQREARLAVTARIDFLLNTDGQRIGIEVKTGGSPADVRRQLARYAATGAIDGLLLVTTQPLHRQWHNTTSHGIPIQVVQPAWI